MAPDLSKMTGKARARYRRHQAATEKVFNGTPVPGWGEESGAIVDPKASEWVVVPDKTEAELLKEKINIVLAGWPWTNVPPNLVSLGPFAINQYLDAKPFAKPVAKQNSLLLNIMVTKEDLRFMLSKYLFRNHHTAAMFSMTSQLSYKLLTLDIHHWDVNDGFYQYCETPRNKESKIQGSVGAVVIVAPIRSHDNPAPNYVDQVKHIHTMSLAMSNFKEYFRNLQLHRVPFLTVDLLSLIIPHMGNLEVLGIYRCELIHIGDTMRLLEIIDTDKVKGKHVALDFFPNYHLGPIDVPGSGQPAYSFGVTWDNAEIDTRLAIWQLVTRILPQARMQGVDFENQHTAFRQWLDKSPCSQVEATISAIMEALDDQGSIDSDLRDQKLVAQIDWPTYHGSVQKLLKRNHNRPEGWTWTVTRDPCRVCKCENLGIFYDYYQVDRVVYITGSHANTPSPMTCLGCKLTEILNQEIDHYKRGKRKIMGAWLNPFLSSDSWDLSKALSQRSLNRAVKAAKKLEYIRVKDLSRGHDHEKHEVQRPLPLSKRTHTYHKSPEIHDKDRKKDVWNHYRKDREFAHGRP